MSFVQALAKAETPVEDAASLAPSHVKVIDLYIACLEIIPRNTVLTFLNRLLDVLRAPNCQTRSVDFSFMDMRGEDIRIIEKYITLPTVQFVDLRRGNFRLHTEQNFRAIKDITSRPGDTTVNVVIYPSKLPEDLENYRKLLCAEDTIDFQRLMMQQLQKREAEPPTPTLGSPTVPQPQVEAPEERRAPTTLEDAKRIFGRHRFTAVQMFEDPQTLDNLMNELRASGRRDEWKDFLDAAKIIHRRLPMSVVDWARKQLQRVKLDFSIYDQEKIDAFNATLAADDAKTEGLIKRCLETMRRHVGMVLKDQKMNEKEAQAKMDSLRKRAESYKNNQKFMLAEDLEEAMALVIDWRPEFGFGAEEDKVQPPKVQYQVVKRPR